MRTFANAPASRFFSRLTIRTKTFIAAAVALICLIGMGVIAVLGSLRDLPESGRTFKLQPAEPQCSGGGQ
jgi:hypothetical protein